MSDQIATESPTGDTPDLQPEAVGTTPSVNSDAEKVASASQAEAVALSPSISADAETGNALPSNHHDLRIEPRIRVRWHADAFIDGEGVYQGFIKDISSRGTDIFLEHNVQNTKFIKLRIYLPPLTKTSPPHIMDVSAKIIYTSYDSTEALFHTGVNFLNFSLESDLEYLNSRIAAVNRSA